MIQLTQLKPQNSSLSFKLNNMHEKEKLYQNNLVFEYMF